MKTIKYSKPVKFGSNDQVNEDIRAREMLVVTDKGEQLGVMPKAKALEEAFSRDLDLLMVAPDGKPPVAKMINYSKYRYDQQKKLKEMKKTQKTVDLKEVRLSPTIQQHDLNTKAKNARKFLAEGDKVKVSIRFYGRMIVHSDVGRKVIVGFAKQLEDVAVIEGNPKMDGRSMFMILGPKDEK